MEKQARASFISKVSQRYQLHSSHQASFQGNSLKHTSFSKGLPSLVEDSVVCIKFKGRMKAHKAGWARKADRYAVQ